MYSIESKARHSLKAPCCVNRMFWIVIRLSAHFWRLEEFHDWTPWSERTHFAARSINFWCVANLWKIMCELNLNGNWWKNKFNSKHQHSTWTELQTVGFLLKQNDWVPINYSTKAAHRFIQNGLISYGVPFSNRLFNTNTRRAYCKHFMNKSILMNINVKMFLSFANMHAFLIEIRPNRIKWIYVLWNGSILV